MTENMADRRQLTRVEMISRALCLKKVHRGELTEFEPPIEVSLLNLSEGGLCIRSEEIFEKEALVTLEVEIEGEIYSGINGKVIWNIPETGTFQYGLHVSNMSGRLFSHAFRLNTGISHQA